MRAHRHAHVPQLLGHHQPRGRCQGGALGAALVPALRLQGPRHVGGHCAPRRGGRVQGARAHGGRTAARPAGTTVGAAPAHTTARRSRLCSITSNGRSRQPSHNRGRLRGCAQENDVRNGFSLPPQWKLANFANATDQTTTMTAGTAGASGLAAYVASQLDQTLTWADVAWLRTLTTLPIIVKGTQPSTSASTKRRRSRSQRNARGSRARAWPERSRLCRRSNGRRCLVGGAAWCGGHLDLQPRRAAVGRGWRGDRPLTRNRRGGGRARRGLCRRRHPPVRGSACRGGCNGDERAPTREARGRDGGCAAPGQAGAHPQSRRWRWERAPSLSAGPFSGAWHTRCAGRALAGWRERGGGA